MIEDSSYCQILGPAGIFIQVLLAVLSFNVLLIKRHKQSPKRPWKIWFMDASKQAASQTIAHFINLAISLILSEKIKSDPCGWYVSINVLDNTLGVLICLGILKFIQQRAFTDRLWRFKSGNYYKIFTKADDERITELETVTDAYPRMKSLQITMTKKYIIINYFDWFVQLIIWNCVVAFGKSILFYIMLFCQETIIEITEFLLSWMKPFPNLQLFLVIVVIPTTMNALAFWVQDNFLKKKHNNEQKQQLI